MGERELQHWVPQHHMRLFAGNSRRIGLVARGGLEPVPSASIRHQCARHMLYGDKHVEAVLGRFETRHALAYRAALLHAWESGPALSALQHYQLREALILQRQRTPATAKIAAASSDQMYLNMYAAYLRTRPRSKRSREVLRAIDAGRARLRHSRAIALGIALSTVEESVPYTQDLALKVVRNMTVLPLLLGDTPCVFSNHYQRGVTQHGVLGLTSQGLIIAMPLNDRTYIIAADTGAYSFLAGGLVVDLDNPTDVTTLNSLQAYAAERCIYFARDDHAAYAGEVLDSFVPSDSESRAGFHMLEQVREAGHAPAGSTAFRVIAGNPRTAHGDLMMVFERQLPATLDLSFVETRKFNGIVAAYGPRCRSIAERFDGIGQPHPSGPLPMEQLVRDVEEQLEIW